MPGDVGELAVGLDVERARVERADLRIACDVVHGLDEPEGPEGHHHGHHQPQSGRDARAQAHAQRHEHVAQQLLLDHGGVHVRRIVAGGRDHALIAEQCGVVDARARVHAERGEKDDLEEVEELGEHERRHAVRLVVVVDAREEVVQIVDVAPLGAFGLVCGERGELGRTVLVLVVREWRVQGGIVTHFLLLLLLRPKTLVYVRSLCVR